MELVLYVNTSEKNKLNKALQNRTEYIGTLKNESSVVTPIIIIEVDNPTRYNYVYIPVFNRYYFIANIVSIRNGLWELSLNVDVLMSFASFIEDCKAVLSSSELVGNSNYLSDSVWVSNVKESTSIVAFPDGLNDVGEYILITAGG